MKKNEEKISPLLKWTIISFSFMTLVSLIATITFIIKMDNQQKRYEEFQQTKLASFLRPNDRERLKNMGYDFTPSYEKTKY